MLQELMSNIIESYECKNSKFISHLFRFDDFNDNPALNNIENFENCKNVTDSANLDLKERFNAFKNHILLNLKNEHKKARHFCYAFRYLNEDGQIITGLSDDLEPKGSAGGAILDSLNGENLINILSVCVRYFGGIKLGIGGLSRAYSKSSMMSVKKALDNNLLKPYQKHEIFSLTYNLSHFDLLVYLLKKYKISIIKKEFILDKISLQLKGQRENYESFLCEIQKS